MRFLVDREPPVSSYQPHVGGSPINQPNVQPIAANSTPISTYGCQHLGINICGHTFGWDFIVADITLPLLGTYFLAHYQHLVDVARSQTPATATDPCETRYLLPHKDLRTPSVLQVLSPGSGQARRSKTDLHRTRASVYLLDGAKFLAFTTPHREKEAHLPPPCEDYRRLNNKTEPDHYPLPNIADITSFLHATKVFSNLDLLKGYYKVPMHPEDIPKTAVATPFWAFTFEYSCFGLGNSSATFQRMMEGILGDFSFCACYMDDILIFSSYKEEHLHHLSEVLGRLQQKVPRSTL
ncbi:uncharacterized protein LOC143041265 [Oratosquilla oratoria]|uniref:uncharacterized protein LOC143041265 n=1 Tax=Oratosquilla oratoria TaxID=337810 RepID=UPI003F75C7FC